MKSRWAVIVIPCAVVVGIGLLWKLTPLAGAVQPERLAAWAERFSASPLAPAVAALLFALAGTAMVPLLVLITATALVFKPTLAVPVSLVGALLSSAVMYFAGAKWVGGHAHRAFGPAIEKVRGALHSRGVLAIASIRMLPIAPFGLINVAAGSIGVRFTDFMLGTALGIAPGTILLSVFGQQVKALWERPTAGRVFTAVSIAVLWVALSWLLQRVIGRRRPI